MTRFVVDAPVVIRLVSEPIDVAPEHELLAPTLLRSQVLSALHEQDTSRGAPRLARRLVEPDLVDGTVRPRPPPPIWHGDR